MKPSTSSMDQAGIRLEQAARDIDAGLKHRDAGKFAEARRVLGRAAEALYALSADSVFPKLREQRLRQADELMDLVESLPERDRPARSSGGGAAAEASDGEKSFVVATDLEQLPGFDDIAGMESVKEEIRLRALYPFSHPEAAARHGLKAGGGILMFGPPGSGKTMMARATAKELGAAFYAIKASDIMSKWVGDAEQNVRALFRQARQNSLSIIFIDEIESLVPPRDDSGSTVMQRVVPQFLAELDGFDTAAANPLLFIGATNKPWAIDSAMLRPPRFDVRVHVGLPDAAARKYLLQKLFSAKPAVGQLDYGALAAKTEGYSGADLVAVGTAAGHAGFKAEVLAGAPVVCDMRLIEECLAKVRPSVSKKELEKIEKWRAENT